MQQFKTLHTHAATMGAVLKAMGNERRLRILCHLADGEHSVGELETVIGLSQSALSQHLARLRHDDLVVTRRSAQTIYYSLNGDTAVTILSAAQSLLGKQNDGQDDSASHANPPPQRASHERTSHERAGHGHTHDRPSPEGRGVSAAE